MQQGGIETACISGNQIIKTLYLPVKWLSWQLSRNYLRLPTNHGHPKILACHPYLYLDGKQSPHNAQVPISPLCIYPTQNAQVLVFHRVCIHPTSGQISNSKEPRVKSLQQKTKAFSLVVIPRQGDGLTNCITVILRYVLRCKSRFSKSNFSILLTTHTHTHIYVYYKSN